MNILLESDDTAKWHFDFWSKKFTFLGENTALFLKKVQVIQEKMNRNRMSSSLP